MHADDPKFPRLSTILVQFQKLWLFSEFGTHVVPSLERILLGFGVAVVVGIGLGLPIGLVRWARVWTMPHIEYWRAMPPPALIPISIVLLRVDIGNKQKVSFIAFFCLFPILLNTIDGVRGIEPTLDGDGAVVRHPVARDGPPHRPARGDAADLRRHAHEPLARGDHHGADGVLVEHERRRLRAAHLEEHVPARRRCGRRSC